MWSEVMWNEVKQGEVMWIEVKWSKLKLWKWSEIKWSKVKWCEVKWSKVNWCEVKWLYGVSVAFIYSHVWVSLYSTWLHCLQNLSLNCSVSFVLCYASIHFSCYVFYLCFSLLYVLIFCVFCDLYCFSLCMCVLFLPFVNKCRKHYHRVETKLQYINIVS